MKVGDEVQVHYTDATDYGMHDKGKYEGEKGKVLTVGVRTTNLQIGRQIVNFWNVDLRPAVALTPFEQRVRSYIDKELRT